MGTDRNTSVCEGRLFRKRSSATVHAWWQRTRGDSKQQATNSGEEMKKNPVKAALRNGEPQIGTWLSFGNLMATRLMARVGFPWLTVDMEHSPIDWSEAGALFGAIADAGCVPLARVPCGDHDHIKRVLDAGAFGIVVPMVDTVDQAREVIAAAKYPPTGTRSLGGTLHALNFDATPGDYLKRANDEILVVLQTESPTGVENAEEIYSLPGVDAIFAGRSARADERRGPAAREGGLAVHCAGERIEDDGHSGAGIRAGAGDQNSAWRSGPVLTAAAVCPVRVLFSGWSRGEPARNPAGFVLTSTPLYRTSRN